MPHFYKSAERKVFAMQDLLKVIRESASTFSKGQKRIAQFIENHYDKAAYMTAATLGQEVGVSESTVVRFALELGFDGYPALQHSIQETVRMRLNSLQRMEMSTKRLAGASVLDAVLSSDIERIKFTAKNIDRDAFDRAVESILSARCIYIIGMRSSSAMAEFLNYYLRYMVEDVRLIRTTSGSEIFEQCLRMGEGDLLIAISFPRYSSRIVNAVDYARQSGAKVIALTDTINSPIARKAHAVLTAQSDMVSFADSLVAPLSIINALLAAVSHKKQDALSATLTKLENAWETFHVYDKSADGRDATNADE